MTSTIAGLFSTLSDQLASILDEGAMDAGSRERLAGISRWSSETAASFTAQPLLEAPSDDDEWPWTNSWYDHVGAIPTVVATHGLTFAERVLAEDGAPLAEDDPLMAEICYRCGREAPPATGGPEGRAAQGWVVFERPPEDDPVYGGLFCPECRTMEEEERERELERESVGPDVFPASWEEGR